jgi:hypothetical protein
MCDIAQDFKYALDDESPGASFNVLQDFSSFRLDPRIREDDKCVATTLPHSLLKASLMLVILAYAGIQSEDKSSAK